MDDIKIVTCKYCNIRQSLQFYNKDGSFVCFLCGANNKLNEGASEEMTEDNNIDRTLKSRGEIYGDYKDNVIARGSIMYFLKDLHYKANGGAMTEQDQQALNDIVIKLVRLAATPEHKDSWHDIIGYAKLNEERLT
jgi:hypothetical protein